MLKNIIALIAIISMCVIGMYGCSTDAEAWMSTAVIGGGVPVTASGTVCSACPSDSDGGDILCDDWENSGSRCTWSDTTGAGGSISHTATHSGTWDTISNKGSNCIQITNVSGTNTYSEHDIGSARTHFYMDFYVSVTSQALGTGRFIEIMHISSGSGGTGVSSWYLDAYDNSGSLEFRIHYLDDSPSWVTVTLQTISAADDYHLEIEWESGTTMKVDVNSTNRLNDTTNIYSTSGQRYIQIGDSSYVADGSTTLQIDNLRGDDDTDPS